MDFQLLRDENDGVKLPGFRYFVKVSLIFYTPASCIDTFTTLSFWVSKAAYNGGGKRSQVSSKFCTYFICAVTAVTIRRCDQNGLSAKCVSNMACVQWDAPTLCTVHQPSVCRLRVSHAVFEQLAILSMSLSFSKEPSAVVLPHRIQKECSNKPFKMD